MHGDTRGSLEFFPIDGGEDPDIIVGSTSGGDQPVILVNHLHEMPDYKRHRLNSFELFFGPQFFSLELDLVLFDVLFLNVEEVQVLVQLLETGIEVLLLELSARGFGGRLDLHHLLN